MISGRSSGGGRAAVGRARARARRPAPPPDYIFNADEHANSQMHKTLPGSKSEFGGDVPVPATGWRRFFARLELLRGRTKMCSDVCAAVSSAAYESAASCPGTKGHARPSGRRRGRRGRRAAAAGLEAGLSIVLDLMRTGGLSRSFAQRLPSTEAGRRLQTAVEAARRCSLLSFESDARGRLRQLQSSIMRACEVHNDIGFLEVSSYTGDTPSVPFIASRLGIPECPAVVDITPWLSDETLTGWRSPEQQPGDDVKGFFRVPIRERRAACRRMARSGLVKLVDANLGDPHRSAGAFAVRKDEAKDRLIADRRPHNAKERACGSVRLPYAPRLRRIILDKGKRIHIGKRDLSHRVLSVCR